MPSPLIRVSISLTPSTITLGQVPSLVVTATLTHEKPITIYTWPTVFNPALAQRRKNFYCIDLSDDEKPLELELTKGGKRSGGVSGMVSSVSDQYIHTLLPGQLYEFVADFSPAKRKDFLITGHRYRFGFAEKPWVSHWAEGTREELMSPPGVQTCFGGGEVSKGKVSVNAGEPVEFEVFEAHVAAGWEVVEDS